MYQITICDDGAGMNPAKKKQDASVGERRIWMNPVTLALKT